MDYKYIFFDFFGTLGAPPEDFTLMDIYKDISSTFLRLDMKKVQETWYVVFNELTEKSLETNEEFSMDDVARLMSVKLPMYSYEDYVILVDAFMKKWSGGVELYEDTLRCIPRLKEKDITLGIISNTNDYDMIPDVIKASTVKDMFSSIILSVEVGIRKPHKGIFMKALEENNIESKDCIFIGNSYTDDIQGALSAGITPIMIDRLGKDGSKDYPEIKSITNFYELEKLL